MKPFKRIVVTVQSSFNSFIDRVENHEALSAQAMAEAKQAHAQASVKFRRLQEDGEKLLARQADLKKAHAQWAERAIQGSQENEARALECVRRMNRAKEDLAITEVQLKQHQELQGQLQEDIAQVEQKLETLRRKQHALATRQYRAEALQALQEEGTGVMEELDSIFERWETKVSETEIYGAGSPGLKDTFEQEFLSQEDEFSLRQSLQDLLTQHKKES